MDKNREKIIEKIRKFLAMTIENGASEAEALMAMRKAAELMSEYDLSLSDVEAQKDEEAKVREYHFRDELSRYIQTIVSGIEKLCSVTILVGGIGSGELTVAGLPVDAEIAEYLLKICVRVFETTYDNEVKRNAILRQNIRRRHVDSVLQGLCKRLLERLNELAWVKRQDASNALVVFKDEKIDEALKLAKISKGPKISNRHRVANEKDFQAGVDLANKVNLANALHDMETTDLNAGPKDQPLLISKVGN